jgi:hypothetical protein
MPHKPGHKQEPGGKKYEGPGGSAGGSMSKRMTPLKRVVEPGSALRTMKKKANPKPVAPKPTRFDSRKVSK